MYQAAIQFFRLFVVKVRLYANILTEILSENGRRLRFPASALKCSPEVFPDKGLDQRIHQIENKVATTGP